MILKAEHLVKSYKRRRVVDDVSVNVNRGEIVGLLGPNGAGKTTSFYMIVGLIRPEQGKIFLDKEDITSLPMYKRAQLGIGYLPQEASIFRKLSVEDNILAVLEMTNLSKQEQVKKMESLLDEFGLAHVRKSPGNVLSGGERNRLNLALTLKIGGNVILLDEPTNDLDVETLQALEQGILSFSGCVVVISHDRWFLDRICTHLLVMEGDGRTTWFPGNWSEYEEWREKNPEA